MIAVGLIVSSWSYWNKPFAHQPLTQLYLATLIDEHFCGKGVNVQVIDLRGIKKESADSHVPECDIFFYTVTSPDYFEIRSLVKKLRGQYPKSKHIAGGTHINIFPKESSQIFDVIVLGDGESSVIKIIDDFRCRKSESVYDLIPDRELAEYPFIRRHYIPEAAVTNKTLFKSMEIKSTSALFARGCPYKCSFCANIRPRKIQMKEVYKIKEEIEYLKKEYSVEGIALNDEVCIPVNKKQALPYLEAIGQTNIKWRGQTRVGVSLELMKLARDSGCCELAFGVESASQQVLDIVNKKIKLNEIKKSIELCKKNGIKVQMCLIVGLPGEPQDIISLTKSFIEDTQPDYVMLAGFCPYPGSDIFNNPEYYGIKRIDHNYNRYSHLIHRFRDSSDEEDTGIPFEYYPKNQWGKTFSRREILNNLLELQDFLIVRDVNR